MTLDLGEFTIDYSDGTGSTGIEDLEVVDSSEVELDSDDLERLNSELLLETLRGTFDYDQRRRIRDKLEERGYDIQTLGEH